MSSNSLLKGIRTNTEGFGLLPAILDYLSI